MRTSLLAGIALCSASLLGLTPLQALASNAPSLERASVAPAAEKSPSASPDTSARKDTSLRKNASARQDVSPRQDAPARQGAAGHERPTSDQSQRARPLDLSAPPINHVMTPEQVQALIGDTDDSGPQDVMVEESRYQAPVPRGQIQALTWALVHPLQAWRIFTPVTDE